jgi:hypothetical protein
VVPCSQHGLPARAADLRGARPLGGGATRFSSDSETVAGSRARGRTEKSLRRLLPIDASVAGRPDDARHLHGGGELGARPHGDAVRPLCRASFSSSRSRLALHSWRHCATGPHPPPRATTRSGVRGSPRISERQRSAAGPRLPPPRATTRRSARGWLHLARRLVAAPVALVFLPGGAARRSGPPLPRRDSKQPSTASRRLPTPDGADPLLHPRAHGGDAFPPATSGDDAPPTTTGPDALPPSTSGRLGRGAALRLLPRRGSSPQAWLLSTSHTVSALLPAGAVLRRPRVTARPQRARQAGRGHGDAAQLLLDTRRPGAALSSTSAHPAAWRSPPFSPSAMAPCRLSRDPRPGGGGGVTPAAGWERRVRGRGPRRPDEFTFVSPCGELSLRGRCVSSFLPLFCKTNYRASRRNYIEKLVGGVQELLVRGGKSCS